MGENENSRSRTVWCGNLSEKTTEIILYELFLQAGPVEDVNIPKDKEGRQRNFGFVIYKHVESVPYAIELLNAINLHGKPLKLDGRDGSKVNDNPYRLALIRHHRSLLPGAKEGLIRIEDHSRRMAARIQQEAQQRASWPPHSDSWVQNGPNVRLPLGMSRFQPGISFQMTSFMSGTAGFPQLNPHLFMLGNNQPTGIFPWQTVGQGISNQLNQTPSQENWFNQLNQRRF